MASSETKAILAMSDLDKLIRNLQPQRISAAAIPLAIGMNPWAAVASFAVGGLASALAVYSPALAARIAEALSVKQPISLTAEDLQTMRIAEISVANQGLATFDAPSGLSFADAGAEAAKMPNSVAAAVAEAALDPSATPADLDRALAEIEEKARAAGDKAKEEGAKRLRANLAANGNSGAFRTELGHVASGAYRGAAWELVGIHAMDDGSVEAEIEKWFGAPGADTMTLAEAEAGNLPSLLGLALGILSDPSPDPYARCRALGELLKQLGESAAIMESNGAGAALAKRLPAPAKAIVQRASEYVAKWCIGSGLGPLTN